MYGGLNQEDHLRIKEAEQFLEWTVDTGKSGTIVSPEGWSRCVGNLLDNVERLRGELVDAANRNH